MAASTGKTERVLAVLWPAFVMAGVLEAMVFAVVDPESLAWFGGAPLGLSRQAVYTVTFFIFWGAIAISSSITTLMSHPPER